MPKETEKAQWLRKRYFSQVHACLTVVCAMQLCGMAATDQESPTSGLRKAAERAMLTI